jgi:hypothetical protein
VSAIKDSARANDQEVAPVISPKDLDTLQRFIAFEDAKADHMRRHPEWWSREGTGHPGFEAAEQEWSRICQVPSNPGVYEVLAVTRRLVNRANESCLIHSDCVKHPELGAGCVSHTRALQQQYLNGADTVELTLGTPR